MKPHWAWLGWLLWSNAITLLQIIQVAIASLMVAADVFTHEQFRIIVITNAVVSAIVAQIKRNTPPGPAPKRDRDDPHGDPDTPA